MSDAPLERLAGREMALSRDSAAAEERMLGALAQIPETALRTRERMHKMQLNDVEAQIKAEAVEQKRIEVGRRMQEAESLFLLRRTQADAQAAQNLAQREKIMLMQARLDLDTKIATTGSFDAQTRRRQAETMTAEEMNRVRFEEGTGRGYRIGPKGPIWLTPEETAFERRKQEAEVASTEALTEQRRASAEASQARAASTDPRARRLATIADAWAKAAAAVERAPPGKDAAAAAIFDTIQQEAKAAAEELRRESSPAKPGTSNPFQGIVPDEVYQDRRRKGMTDEQIRAQLKAAGLLK